MRSFLSSQLAETSNGRAVSWTFETHQTLVLPSIFNPSTVVLQLDMNNACLELGNAPSLTQPKSLSTNCCADAHYIRDPLPLELLFLRRHHRGCGLKAAEAGSPGQHQVHRVCRGHTCTDCQRRSQTWTAGVSWMLISHSPLDECRQALFV